MREIKFEIWDKRDKKMFRWDALKDFYEKFLVGLFATPDVYHIVRQYTGLKDKNGKEIYEGDIVELKQWRPTLHEVLFDRGAFCFREARKEDKDNWNFYHDCKYLEEGTVIGNIYENPELLTTQPQDK